MVKIVCEVQTNQPKAVPISFEMPYNENIIAIAKGYAPRPPLVKPTAKLPKMNPIIMISKLMFEVSGKAKIVT